MQIKFKNKLLYKMRLLLWLYMLNLKFAIRTANLSPLIETPQMQDYMHTQNKTYGQTIDS